MSGEGALPNVPSSCARLAEPAPLSLPSGLRHEAGYPLPADAGDASAGLYCSIDYEPAPEAAPNPNVND